jgi:cell division protease FtsH
LEKPIEELQEDQRRQIAYHEAGHAVATHYYRPEHRIVRATIIGRGGGVLGYVQPVPKYEEYAKPLRLLVADIMVGLAGHVATKVFLGEYWTGAYSDFDKVRASIMHLAALGYFGPPVKQPGAMNSGGEFSGREREMERFWTSLEDQCERFIKVHAKEVDGVAAGLLDRESLTGDEVVQIINQAKMVAASELEDNVIELGEKPLLNDGQPAKVTDTAESLLVSRASAKEQDKPEDE